MLIVCLYINYLIYMENDTVFFEKLKRITLPAKTRTIID